MPTIPAILLFAWLPLSVPVLSQDEEEEDESGHAGYGEALDDSGTLQNSEPWVALFDGRTLEGWTTHGGRYDGNANWTVENGAITGREGARGAGGLIYTEKAYRDFELEADVRISYPFDSGFFLRMTPPEQNLLGAQVTLDWRPEGEIGGIYCDGSFFHNPGGAERFKKEDWNHFVVRCVGDPMHITVWMNGEPLTDFRIPEQSGVFAKSGLIGLQVHGSPGAPEGSRVRFKNIRLREVRGDQGAYFLTDERGSTTVTEQGREAGWHALFDGKSLAGWKAEGDGTGYRVKDGVLEFLVAGESPHLATVDDFQDFQLRMEFAISRRANSGLFLRAARDGSNPAFSGCEVQILDDFHWEEDTNSKLEPYQFTGGLYGSVAPAKRDALKPLGEWNTYDITFHGSRIVAYLNGALLYDVDTSEVHVPEDALPFAQRASKGFIGLQRHGPAGTVEGDAYARFRNLFVREL